MEKDPESKQKKLNPGKQSENDDLFDLFDDIPDLQDLEDEILDLSEEVDDLSGKTKKKSEPDEIIDLFEEAEFSNERDLIDLTEEFADFEDKDQNSFSFTDEELRALEGDKDLLDIVMYSEGSGAQKRDKTSHATECKAPAKLEDDFASWDMFDQLNMPFDEKNDELQALIEDENLSSKEDEIIELTEEVDLSAIGVSDEEPVELTEEVGDAPSAVSDEEPIELTEEVDLSAAGASGEEPVELAEGVGLNSLEEDFDAWVELADKASSDFVEEKPAETAEEDESVSLTDELGLALMDAEKDESVESADELGLVPISKGKDEPRESEVEAWFDSNVEERKETVESTAGDTEKEEKSLGSSDFESLDTIVDGFASRLPAGYFSEKDRDDSSVKIFEPAKEPRDDKAPVHIESPGPRTVEPEKRGIESGDVPLSFEKKAAEKLVLEVDETKGSEDAIKLTEEAIDKALERVIRKVFADKIEHILLEAVKKVATEDIARLKKMILEKNGDKSKD